MKASKLRDMTQDELRNQESQLEDQIFRLRFQVAASQAENPSKIRLLRKDLARVKTVLREMTGPIVRPGKAGAAASKGVAAETAAAPAPAPDGAPRRKATAKSK